ncbi:hypothetical protein, partial [Rhizobium rhizogenes]|uniref:hypothetical protein n=1 Tax=Rhizobium rhizogenes TaxID=359 RepID=UPI001AED7D8F
PANPITRYSAMKSARLLGFATSRHLHHVPGHDQIGCCDRLLQQHFASVLLMPPTVQNRSGR